MSKHSVHSEFHTLAQFAGLVFSRPPHRTLGTIKKVYSIYLNKRMDCAHTNYNRIVSHLENLTILVKCHAFSLTTHKLNR